jgi:hypothetical protein
LQIADLYLAIPFFFSFWLAGEGRSSWLAAAFSISAPDPRLRVIFTRASWLADSRNQISFLVPEVEQEAQI